VETPAFMPVGTYGTVKGLDRRDLRECGAQIILGNAFHLRCRPGPDRIRALGGLHRCADWDGPILTDSGGFQVFSLGSMRKLDEGGVTFRNPHGGELIRLTPESVIEAQVAYGVDVAMVLDDCAALPSTRDQLRVAMDRTLRWARRARAVERDAERGPAVFGIVQGGLEEDFRAECAVALTALDFDGYAIGGLSVGEGPEAMIRTVSFTAPRLPDAKVRYLMGVGYPWDIVEAVACGVDLFDCVIPTRNARNGNLFTSEGRVIIKNAKYRDDPAPLDPACSCSCCRHYSRGWLRHLFVVGEMLGTRLLTLHNVHFWQNTMRQIHEAIVCGTLPRLLEQARAARAASLETEVDA
jgi:queuine tRNA-ribosyltransferase